MTFDALSFAGCGTLNFYQTGVAYVFQQAGLTDEILFAGASAGAGLSVLLASGVDMRLVHDTATELLAPHRGKNILSHPTMLKQFATSFLTQFVDAETLPKIGERVHISVTTLRPFGNHLINQFTDVEDLLQAIRASCHLPSFKYPSIQFRGRRCLDGGFTRNNPKVGQTCLRVSPFFFDPRMKINPRRLTPPWWGAIIPSTKRATKLFEQGIRDAERYIRRSTRKGT
jgi:predicted acylesterase/phospholipase RssA